MPDKTEKPIMSSRTLTKAEQGYSQIDEEAALEIYWSLHKFLNYYFRRKFTLVTNHQPLTQILNPSKSLPTLLATRMLHALFILGFNFDIRYRRSEANINVDFSSRFPVENSSNNEVDNLVDLKFIEPM